ncbi:hypothetical protein Scep_011764 [Stephania cephalantha]|uniref:FYVE-type domain-containing protein n=1 Tax=Stephania cephalantha TaxID=152367 RepID=A0AAP0P994_9MAGN
MSMDPISSQNQEEARDEECGTGTNEGGENEDRSTEVSIDGHRKQDRYFSYDLPHCEETGDWIPISVPPMSESGHEDWRRGLGSNKGFLLEEEMGWDQFVEEEKQITMWDVVLEMLLAARGKMNSFSPVDVCSHQMYWMSNHFLEQTWKDMSQTLSQEHFANAMEILEAEPPKWLPDSSASSCMLCSVRFHPLMCSRHHCRFCGGLFCDECSRGRSLLPVKFRLMDPQRVCDACSVRLDSVQSYLMDQVSHAAQLPTHDVTDLSTLRSWLNFPWGNSMESEIYKAANTVRGYNKVGFFKPERSIPDFILRQAKGLAILTVARVGVVVTYNIGTGLVLARREDGSWSPPSSISSFGVGWGAQVGGELADFIIVLRTDNAVKTFSGNIHFSVGAGLSAAAGTFGRAFEADLHAGDGSYAACYTYSCSKGAFVGCSLQGSVITTRNHLNSQFYGSTSITASDILLGSLPCPPAASILYSGLRDLFQRVEQ